MDDLKLMVERCDEAIEQTPNQADLHRDRALVLTLLGDHAKACGDVELALSLLKQSSRPVDPMLQHELQVRQSTCKPPAPWRTTIDVAVQAPRTQQHFDPFRFARQQAIHQLMAAPS